MLPGEAVAGPPGAAGADLAAAGERVGFPLVVKATHGGGGIGMRVVRDPADLAGAVEAARRQAGGAFGGDEVFLERWLEAPRHVEVQLLADAGGRMVHLFERECSIQRRHQKLVEEAPSPAVGPALRERLGAAALAVGRTVGYVGAGTVEFLLSGDELWFLEVNARIQVEHPVTEAVADLDLVRLQLQVAAGEPRLRSSPGPGSGATPSRPASMPRTRQRVPAPGGDPAPLPGRARRDRPGSGGARGPPGGPGGWGVRVDAGVADGSVVGVHYDPLLAKVVAHAPTRPEAARLLASTLTAARLHGIVTNRDLLVGVLRSEAFGSGETDTAFLDRHPPAELTAAGGAADPLAGRLHAAAAALAAQAERRATARGLPGRPLRLAQQPLPAPAGRPPARPGPRARSRRHRQGRLPLRPHRRPRRPGGARRPARRAAPVALLARRAGRGNLAPRPGGRRHPPPVRGPPGRHHLVRGQPPRPHRAPGTPVHRGSRRGIGWFGHGTGRREWATVAPLPGIVRRVAVRVGDRVEVGAVLVVVEAMKTEHRIAATRAGTVRQVPVAEGQEVAAGATVVEFEEAAGG